MSTQHALDPSIEHDEESVREALRDAAANASHAQEKVNTVTCNTRLDNEDEFFTTSTGTRTLVNRRDLEQTVPNTQKPYLTEIDRYWVNKPFAFIIIFRSERDNETKYVVVEPVLNTHEQRVLDFLKDKLRETMRYSDIASHKKRGQAEKAAHIEAETFKLLKRYRLITENAENAFKHANTTGTLDDRVDNVIEHVHNIPDTIRNTSTRELAHSLTRTPANALTHAREHVGHWRAKRARNTDEHGDGDGDETENGDVKGNGVMQKVLKNTTETSDDDHTTTRSHVYTQPHELTTTSEHARPSARTGLTSKNGKLSHRQTLIFLYYLKRDSIMYKDIDAIKHDINVEDISCDGYNQRAWVYHTEHEQIITNITHDPDDLDDFVVKLAQRSGKSISKREPQVDATLPDGSRAQLTLGTEVSDHGTNYTIRQFNEIPFTPVDLVNWKTFHPAQMAYLWLAIENNKNMIFAGGTASGKTTSLNAISLFIPSNTKVVSIEDTREVELPQENWVASVTRDSFSHDGTGNVDEFDLLEAALRQRPDYIVMGEIRGEEGRTLFQVMSTGHTTYTTFHADTVGEVIKRFTTAPINVSKTLFAALDLVSIQTSTRVGGDKVRRNKVLTEINGYTSETDDVNVRDVYTWSADTDAFTRHANSSVLQDIKFERGWSDTELQRELDARETVLAYLIKNRANTYAEVAATVQAFMNSPRMILELIARDTLMENLSELRDMESIGIDINEAQENMVPRPEPPGEVIEWCDETLTRAHDTGVLTNTSDISRTNTGTPERVHGNENGDELAINNDIETILNATTQQPPTNPDGGSTAPKNHDDNNDNHDSTTSDSDAGTGGDEQ